MRDWVGPILLLTSVVFCTGQQQCTQLRTFPLYLSGIYCILSSYHFQHDLTKFNVKDLNAWGKGGTGTGITITKENQATFRSIMSEYNLCLNQDEALDDSQLRALNDLLAVALMPTPTQVCLDGSLRVTGTYVKMSDVASISCPAAINRLEIFASDTVYFDNNYTNSKEDFHLNIVAPHWFLGRTNCEISIPKGDFVGIQHDFFSVGSLKISTDVSKFGAFNIAPMDGLVFYESEKKALQTGSLAKTAAENFVSTITNFQSFMRESVKDRVLQERATPFFLKVSASSHTKPEGDLSEKSLLTDLYGFYKTMNLSGITFNIPLENIKAATDEKMTKLIYVTILSEISSFGDNKYRGLVVDVKALANYFIENMQNIENLYSGSLLERVRKVDEDNVVRMAELAIIKEQRREREKFLRDLVEANLAFLRGLDVEVEDAANGLKSDRLQQIGAVKNKTAKAEDDFPNYVNYMRQRILVEVVGYVSVLMRAIPLAAKMADSRNPDGLEDVRRLVHNVSDFCPLMTNRIKREEEEIKSGPVMGSKQAGNTSDNELSWEEKETNDICDLVRPLLVFGDCVVKGSISSYEGLKSSLSQCEIRNFLEVLGYFVGRYYGRSGGLRDVVRRLKFAAGGAGEIVDAVARYDKDLKLEGQVNELMSLKYGAKIVEDLEVLEEGDVVDVNRRIAMEMKSKNLGEGKSFLKSNQGVIYVWTLQPYLKMVKYKIDAVYEFLSYVVETDLIHFAVRNEYLARYMHYSIAIDAINVVTRQHELMEILHFNDTTLRNTSMEVGKDFSHSLRKWELLRVIFLMDIPTDVWDIKSPDGLKLLISHVSNAIMKVSNFYLETKSIFLNLRKLENKTNIYETFKLQTKTLELISEVKREMAKCKEALKTELFNYEERQKKISEEADLRIKGLNLFNTLESINHFSKSHVMVLEYARLLNALKQSTFPIAKPYFAHFDLPSESDIKASTPGSTQRLKHFKLALQQSAQTLPYDEYKQTAVSFDAGNPFYTFNNPRVIKDLLNGKEVFLLADIQHSDLSLTAIKFNKIGLVAKTNYDFVNDFEEEALKWTVSLTHLGDSKYSCGGKIYAIPTPLQKLRFSLGSKAGTNESLAVNSVYQKISSGDYVLSPYASWQLQIVKGLDLAKARGYLEMANHISLHLVGRGQYYEGSTEMCSEDLDKYYDRFYDVYEPPEAAARAGLAKTSSEGEYFAKPLRCTTAKQPWVTEKARGQDTVQELSFKHNVQ